MTIWESIERKIDGHVNIGPLTLFGANAMHWGGYVHTRRWGFVCFRLPLPCFGRFWPLYLYCSPNATPWASTWYRSTSRCEMRENHKKADERRASLGHNFSVDRNYKILMLINYGPNWEAEQESFS